MNTTHTHQITELDTPAHRSSATKTVAYRLIALLVAAVALLTVTLAQPAAAARSIQPAAGLQCERYDNKLSVSAPRVWATSRTEQVRWAVVIEHWNGRGWVEYSHYNFYSTFNVYGQSHTSWGNWYAGNTMNIPVRHRGYYRMYSAVFGSQGGGSGGWVDHGRHCYVY